MSIVFNKISEPYAKALLEFSIANNCIGEMNRSVSLLAQIITTPKVKKLLNDPFLSREAKIIAFEHYNAHGFFVHQDPGLFSFFMEQRKETLQWQLHIGSRSLLYMLIDRNRIEILEVIKDKFQELACNHLSLKPVVIISSVPIKAWVLANFKNRLRLKYVTSGSQFDFIQKVEPSLLGGFTIEMDSKRIDASISGQLLQLSSFLGL